jgi:hypothetical protein
MLISWADTEKLSLVEMYQIACEQRALRAEDRKAHGG